MGFGGLSIQGSFLSIKLIRVCVCVFIYFEVGSHVLLARWELSELCLPLLPVLA